MADKFELIAVASEAGFGVPVIARDAFHFSLRHGAVVVVLAVRAPAAASLLLVNLHGLANGDPIDLVGRWLVAWVLRPEHPVLDDGLGVLLVLGRGDEFLAHRQAGEALGDDHKFFHAVLLYCKIDWQLTRRGTGGFIHRLLQL